MRAFGDVDLAYSHIAKTATSQPALRIGRAELKWYDLTGPEPVPDAIRDDAQAYLCKGLEAGLQVNGDDAGFVILHRCGTDFYFLLTSVWRGSNELWEAVHYRDGSMAAFAAFEPAYAPVGVIRPTFCVWELGIVAHEALAWGRYLRSPRDEADREAWRADRLTGSV